MSRTENFRKQHAELVKMVQDMQEACLKPGQLPGQSAKAVDMLNNLAGKITVHLAMEDNSLYPSLLKHADAEIQKKAKAFITEMGNLKQVFLGYHSKWNKAAIEKDSAGFVAETNKIFTALGDRIKRENTDLYVMVDKLG